MNQAACHTTPNSCMTPLTGTTTIESLAQPAVQSRNWLYRMFQARLRSQPIDPWSTAVSQVEHLDAHILRDIGAPRWVMQEVARRNERSGAIISPRCW